MKNIGAICVLAAAFLFPRVGVPCMSYEPIYAAGDCWGCGGGAFTPCGPGFVCVSSTGPCGCQQDYCQSVSR